MALLMLLVTSGSGSSGSFGTFFLPGSSSFCGSSNGLFYFVVFLYGF